MNRWIVVACLLGSVRPLDARCAMQELAPLVLTRDREALPPDGGVLVAWTWVTRGDPLAGDPSKPPGWKLGALVTTVTLAPGVTVYRPTGALTITDQGKPFRRFTRDPKRAVVAMPTPAVTKLRAKIVWDGRQNRTTIEADLGAAPPASAIGVIVYRVTGKQQVALSFLPVSHDASATTIEVYRDAVRCTFNPPGMMAAAVGDQVALAWVDAFGRLSKPGNVVKVD